MRDKLQLPGAVAISAVVGMGGVGKTELVIQWQRLLTEEHPDVATSYNNLAGLYSSTGRYSEAEPLYIKALEIASKSLGANHPNTITVRENLKSLRDKYA